MRRFLGLVLFLGWSSANAEPKCVSYPKSPIPPEVRVEVWNQFLQDNPKSEHRDQILKEIEQALGEMWGKPDCDALLRDATVNPFKDYPAKKSEPLPFPTSRDATIDPFRTQDGMLVDPFKKKSPPQNSSSPDENGTYNPFSPTAPKGPPKGSKKPNSDSTLDPWKAPSSNNNNPSTQEEPISIDNDSTLVDPFRKRKSK